MPLLWYLIRRIMVTIPVLWLITVLGFALTSLIPADPLAMVLSERAMANPEIVKAYRERWGFDKPPILRYLTYIQNLLRGDLGESIATQRPVKEDLARFLPATVELAVAATLIAILLGVPLGVVAALYRDRWPDHVARFLSLIGVSMPVFWLGLLALTVFYYHLQLLPGPGRLDPRLIPPPTITGLLTIDSLLARRWDAFWDALRHLVLPASVLGAYSMSLITRITRSSMIEVLAQEYIRVARAKGLREWIVIGRHALRNAAIPTVTAMGLAFGNLMAGAVMTETVFAWPGIGRYAVDAASKLDFPPVMGVTLLVAGIYVLINFLVDLSYTLLDPRIRLE
ncbi:MAG: ABC transporter permease [Anaerolineae bacterium]|nr:ABC transporter permease [Thermoflexus sp.]MDW8065953.1 ABC transporter permease [Anaerolineae bacterium]